MVRVKPLEIRWHDTQPIYSCSFAPVPPHHLRKVLDYNHAQARGAPPGSSVPSGLFQTAGGTESGAGSTSGAGGSGSCTGAAGNALAAGIQAGGQTWKLATAGGDNNVRLWHVHPNIPSPAAMAAAASSGAMAAPHPPRVEYLATLHRHTGVVNVVRWCPKGETLATAGDDGNVLLWAPCDRKQAIFFGDNPDDVQFEKEFWRARVMRRVTSQEIYDMAWSPNGESLIVGGTDFAARIISASDGTVLKEIAEHNHYVQGVAWDPLNEYIATQSSDRSVHIHSIQHHANEVSVQTVGRAHRMEIYHASHRRTPSGSALWDSHARPSLKRRESSQTSDSDAHGDRQDALEASGQNFPRPPTPASTAGRPPTPTSTSSTAMNPPAERPSRRSSFGSAVASPPVSSTSASARFGRSPSPMPPLPAIRAPPSPRQQAEQAAPLPLTRATLRMYGDENFTGFFRRLAFSPDGALLLTPAGLVEDLAALIPAPQLPSPTTPGPASASGHGGGDPQTPGQGTGGATKGASPMGQASSTNANKSAVYVYSRANLSKPPIARLPGHKSATLAVKFSPVLYELRNDVGDVKGKHREMKTVELEVGRTRMVHINDKKEEADKVGETSRTKGEGVSSCSSAQDVPSASSASKLNSPSPGEKPASAFNLPYRMIFAVATQDSVFLYDTQQMSPFCCFSQLHYASFTDLAWSPDGQTLMMTSTDGYCSVVVFDFEELGVAYHYQPQLLASGPMLAHGQAHHVSPRTASSVLPALSSAPPVSSHGGVSIGKHGSESSPEYAMKNTPPPTPLVSGGNNDSLGLAGASRPPSASASTSEAAKRDASSESGSSTSVAPAPAPEEDQPKKKRRIAPTLVGNDGR